MVALAEIGARIEAKEQAHEGNGVAKPATMKPAKIKQPARKQAVDKPAKLMVAKPKRTSALDAAARVLDERGKPLRSQELIDLMAEKGYCSRSNGRTPAASLYAALIRAFKTKGKDARFNQAGPGSSPWQ